MAHTTLISTDELAAHLDDPAWVVVDCRFTLTDTGAGRRAYDQGHLPGARYAHLDDDLSGPRTPSTGRHPLPDPQALAAKLSLWGIGPTSQVVVYDDSFGAMAGRLWWLLRWLGHEAVALLDGGYPKWKREQRPVSTEAPHPVSAVFVPHPTRSAWLSTAEVEAVRGDRLLLDARAEPRFRGEVEPIDPVAGHIPGAVNRPFEENLDESGCFLPAEELRAQFSRLLGPRSPDQVINSCGSGVTACHNLLAMETAGLKGARLYAGSWSEWIRDPSRPVATGG